MGANTYPRRVRRWWAQQEITGTPIDVLEIKHPAIDNLVINNYGKEFYFTDETGKFRVSHPIGFEVTNADVGLSTRQDFQVLIDPLDGAFHRELRKLDANDRLIEMQLIHRMYLSSFPGRPMVEPVTKLTVLEIESERQALMVTATARNHPNKRVGSYYELEVFPELRYLI